MTVADCGEYKVFYADFTKKFLGKNQQYMPTALTKYDTVELQFWKYGMKPAKLAVSMWIG